MSENYVPRRARVIQMNNALSENSMRPVGQLVGDIYIIDVKSKCLGLVLNTKFNNIDYVTVKLISDNLPDRTYYSVSGSELQMILQERYSPLADNLDLFAIIPFALKGNLLLNDDSYLQVTVSLINNLDLNYDRIISAEIAANPLVVKNLKDADLEFDSAQYDELFFVRQFADVRFHLNGQLVSLPQVLYKNMQAIQGFASQKLIPNTSYTLSEGVPCLLVEY